MRGLVSQGGVDENVSAHDRPRLWFQLLRKYKKHDMLIKGTIVTGAADSN